MIGRFAPTTNGPAHPGTLLAALLCWLDARSRGGRVVLRLEDLDPERCRPEFVDGMRRALEWLGLDWDEERLQSHSAEAHAAALDALAERGLLYPCSCSRSVLRRSGRRARDGALFYPGTCRDEGLPGAAVGGWRAVSGVLRARLPAGLVELQDESGLALGADPSLDSGDPVVRRRDGSVAYHLASVVDDASLGVTRIVRGRDLAPSTAVQVSLQRLLGLPTPVYRHHLLLLERRDEKLSKLHGSVGLGELRSVYSPEELCGQLAAAAGLQAMPAPIDPPALLAEFAWSRVRARDVLLHWDGASLSIESAPA